MSEVHEHGTIDKQNSEGDSAESATPEAIGVSSYPLALPMLVGAALIVINAVVVFKQKGLLIPNNLTSAVFVTLVGSSLLLGAFLLVYAAFLKRGGNRSGEKRSWFVTCVVVPLVVGVMAVTATLTGLTAVYPLREKQISISSKPCIQIYQQAASIRDVNPRFKMPNNDPDQRRCKINETVLR